MERHNPYRAPEAVDPRPSSPGDLRSTLAAMKRWAKIGARVGGWLMAIISPIYFATIAVITFRSHPEDLSPFDFLAILALFTIGSLEFVLFGAIAGAIVGAFIGFLIAGPQS
jgi:hypothetical protein